MIVSHRHRFIFIKTRKTAGTSIEVALSRIAGDDAIVTPFGDPEPGHEPRNFKDGLRGSLRWTLANPEGTRHGLAAVLRDPRGRQHRAYYNHMPAWMVRAHLGRETWESYFKFCFERNPWDKMASKYFWLAQRQDVLPFEDWLLTDRRAVSDWPIYAIDGECAVDAVGRYETLDADLDRFLQRIGVSTEDVELPRAKPGTRPPRPLYSPRAVEHVRRVFSREIQAFGYDDCPPELLVGATAGRS